MKVRVLLADDQRLVVDAFAHLLRLDPDFTEVSQTYTVEDGLREATRLKPDIAVFDTVFPGRDSFDLLPELQRECPQTKIVLLTEHLTDMFLWQAIRLSVSGYVMKDESPIRVVEILKRVAMGAQLYSKAVQDRLVWNEGTRCHELKTRLPLMELTVQQLAVVRHFARGESLKQVALALRRSEKSIDSQKYRVMHRLGVKDRVDLCHMAIREGLILV